MEIVPVYVGLDYHSETIRVCVMDVEGQTLVNRSVANDPAAVVDLVRVNGGLVRAVAIEACCGAADFATALSDMTEWTVRMAHPSGVNRMKQGPDKTDHTDAWHLASLLREDRVNCSCEKSAWSKPWMEWIKSVKLGEQTRWVLDQELRRLEQSEEDVKSVDQRLEQATENDPVVALLKEQPGVGAVTAVTMRAVIGRFDRFRTGKQLSKYCGVSPCNASSGGRQSDAGLIDSGNDILRALLMQLAKRLPRHHPRWKELHAKLRVTKGANVASAAIANRWLRKLYHEMVIKVKQKQQEQSASQTAMTQAC